MSKKQCVNYLFHTMRSLCEWPTLCYLVFHSSVLGGRLLPFRLAADPLRTMPLDGDCWLCHLVKLDVTRAASLDCRNVDGNVLFFFFFFFLKTM
uniref:Uncharacterized protein n=1 Tax=Cercocebus atys TaxID=9531 RepID=A0A2K5LQM0_CERAT